MFSLWPAKKKIRVIGYRHDGLGSRLMAMGNGIRLAKRFNCDYHYVWTGERGVASMEHASELFDVKGMRADRITFGHLLFSIAIEGEGLIYPDSYRHRLSAKLVRQASVLWIGCSHYQRIEGERYPRMREELSAAFSRIRPSAAVRERIEKFRSENDLKNAVGIHVRRGDIVDHRREIDRVRVIDLAHYFRALEVMQHNGPLFLCTEDAAVQEEFAKRYPGKVMIYPGRYGRDDPEATADAFAEIWLLSETRFVVAGPSAFNRAAAGRGNIPLVTVSNADDTSNHLIASIEMMNFSRLQEAERLVLACRGADQNPLYAGALRRLRRLQGGWRGGRAFLPT